MIEEGVIVWNLEDVVEQRHHTQNVPYESSNRHGFEPFAQILHDACAIFSDVYDAVEFGCRITAAAQVLCDGSVAVLVLRLKGREDGYHALDIVLMCGQLFVEIRFLKAEDRAHRYSPDSGHARALEEKGSFAEKSTFFERCEDGRLGCIHHLNRATLYEIHFPSHITVIDYLIAWTIQTRLHTLYHAL